MVDTITLSGWGKYIAETLPLLYQPEHIPGPLRALHECQFRPLLEANGNISDTLSVRIAPSGSSAVSFAHAMVDYAYSHRFAHDILERFQEDDENSRVIIVTDRQNPHIIWATLRVSWGPSIDIFQLFSLPKSSVSIEKNQSNPIDKKEIGSIGRMGLHPLFDTTASLNNPADHEKFNHARIALTRGLTQLGLVLLKEAPTKRVYVIATGAIHLWLSMCGVQSRCVADAAIADTETVAELRHRYPGYWQSNPKLFELTSWELEGI